MKPKDSYEVRTEMADMHSEFIDRLNSAVSEARYIEASWLCYAIFEQRIWRVIEKIIDKCPKDGKTDTRPVSISVRIDCIKKLMKYKYAGIEKVDTDALVRVKNWCSRRNKLVHALVDIKRYRTMDDEFRELALCGQDLVKELYEKVGTYRTFFNNEIDNLPEFPKEYISNIKDKEGNKKCIQGCARNCKCKN
jgi:hypothetical protein